MNKPKPSSETFEWWPVEQVKELYRRLQSCDGEARIELRRDVTRTAPDGGGLLRVVPVGGVAEHSYTFDHGDAPDVNNSLICPPICPE